MIYTINNCIRAFGYTNFNKLIEDKGSIDGLKEYVRANGYADIAVAEDTELLLVDVNGKTWHTGCYGAVIEPEPGPEPGPGPEPEPEPERDYLCFTSTGDSTVAMTQVNEPTDISKNKVIQYKLNDGQWQNWNLSAVTLADGDKMYLKSDDEIPMAEGRPHKQFKMTGSISASGNVMSLLNFSTTLPDHAFYSLFYNCTSLTTAPVLPATTLAPYCYYKMFYGCTSLTQAPTLPATTLEVECYENMFTGCTSLTQGPELPATTLTRYCYYQMFKGCTNLNYVKAMFISIEYSSLSNWLTNVSPTGTFIKSKDAAWTNEQAGIPTGWTVQVEGGVTPEPEPTRDYLCFTSTGDSTVAMQQFGTPTDISKNKVIQYKLNNGQWQTWDLSAVTLSDGDKMYVKSDDTKPMGEFLIYKKFVMTGSIAASGSIMSLVNFSDTLPVYAFYFLFNSCAQLTTAPELPATTLSEGCYREMFSGCTSLTQSPALPATTVVDDCYYYMFYGCTSLTTAPELPATILTRECYGGMFEGCTKLNYVKALFTNIADFSVDRWLNNVSATGTFVKNAAATWTNEQAGIPSSWTVQTATPDK